MLLAVQVTNNSIQHIPSWEASNSPVSRAVPYILRSHYHVHKNRPHILILSHINPVQNQILFLYGSFSVFSSNLGLGFPSDLLFPSPRQNPLCISPLFHSCHMPCQPNCFCSDDESVIFWIVQVMELYIVQSPPVPKTQISASVRCSQTSSHYLPSLIRTTLHGANQKGRLYFCTFWSL